MSTEPIYQIYNDQYGAWRDVSKREYDAEKNRVADARVLYKEAPSADAQAKPVAWRRRGSLPSTFICDPPKNLDYDKWEPLYTAPPAQPEQPEQTARTVDDDVRDFGIGFMVDGRRIEPSRVSVHQPAQDLRTIEEIRHDIIALAERMTAMARRMEPKRSPGT